jgi:hypothetical protein
MNRIVLLVAVAATAGVIACLPRTSPGADADHAAAQSAPSALEIRGATPYFEIKDEPPAKLIVDEPLPDPLALGVVSIQWRVENVQIVPVFGKAALSASPRVGHLHVNVDDLPWVWADAGNVNTITLAGMPPGQHKVRIDLSNATHEIFPGQSRTVTFTIPPKAAGAGAHSH